MIPLPLAGSHGEFGWTLPAGDQHAPMEQLADLVTHAGVSWVKYPVWYSEHEITRPEEITWFAERLKKNGTKLVGLLDQPPPDIHELFGEANRLEAAQVFADNDLWQKHLNLVLTRLSLKIRWWQLAEITTSVSSKRGYPLCSTTYHICNCLPPLKLLLVKFWNTS